MDLGPTCDRYPDINLYLNMYQVASHSELSEQINHWRKKGNTHQRPPRDDGHNINHADDGAPHTNIGAQGDAERQA